MRRFAGVALVAACMAGCQKAEEKSPLVVSFGAKIEALEKDVKELYREVARLKMQPKGNYRVEQSQVEGSAARPSERAKALRMQRMQEQREKMEDKRREREERRHRPVRGSAAPSSPVVTPTPTAPAP